MAEPPKQMGGKNVMPGIALAPIPVGCRPFPEAPGVPKQSGRHKQKRGMVLTVRKGQPFLEAFLEVGIFHLGWTEKIIIAGGVLPGNH